MGLRSHRSLPGFSFCPTQCGVRSLATNEVSMLFSCPGKISEYLFRLLAVLIENPFVS